MRTSATAWMSALLAAVSTQAAVLHVCPDGTGNYASLRAAVAAAEDGDVIELCDGIFGGLDNVEIDVESKSLAFRSINGYEATTIDAAVLGGEFNEYQPHVAFRLGPGSATRIEGVSIIDAGNVDLDTWEYGDGGAIRCLGSSLELDRVKIDGRFPRGAVRGAGVFVEDGTLTAIDCVFTDNRADYGAAVYAGGPASLLRCSFRGNGTCSGAVVELRMGGRVEDCVFQSSGWAATACGSDSDPGGRALALAGGPATVLRTEFIDNHSASGGTGIVSRASDLLVQECAFEDCSSTDGSCASISRGTIRRSRFVRHYAANSGGVLWCGAGPVVLEECVFVDSRNAVNSSRTGATVRVGGSAKIRGCTLVGTTSGVDIALEPGVSATVANTIVAFSASPWPRVLCGDPAPQLEVSCTDVYGNGGGDWIGCLAGLADQDGNFAADPRFCNADAEDFGLRADSPCARESAGACGLVGALPVACGTTALGSSTWGQIKGMYR